MTMIRSLPSSYASFASSLQLLNKLDKDTLQVAFINEESLRTRSSTPGSTSVLSATALQLICDFCSISGHFQRDCHRYKRMKEQASQGSARENKGQEEEQG